MKTVAPFVALVLLALFAGCTGGGLSNNVVPAGPNGTGSASQTLSAAQAVTPDRALPCNRHNGCPAQLVAPLAFDGTTFSVNPHFRACGRSWIGGGRPYTATTTGTFMLASSVTLAAVCGRLAKPNTQVYLAVAQKGGRHGHGRALAVSDGGTTTFFTPLGGPVNWTDSPWTFAPIAPGINMTAKSKYVFFLVAVANSTPTPPPSATPTPSGNYVLLQPMSYDGTTFAPVANQCFHGDPHDAPPYVAPTSGPLAIPAAVTVTPTCVPSPLPSFSPLPQLYMVAIQLGDDDAKRASKREHLRAFKLPMDFHLGVPAVAIAGPANIPDNPWSFAPDAPGLTMTGGASYVFFIAIAVPTPPPVPSTPQPYRAVVPLNFDGTNFTVPTIASCTSIGTPAPYVPTSTGPLTLAAPVTVTPTCAPAAPSASATPAPLYVVATLASWHHDDRGGNPGHGHGPPGGSHGGDGCTIFGIAIAGPANVADNPWSFTPLSPALTLVSGVSYAFYVGQPIGDSRGHH